MREFTGKLDELMYDKSIAIELRVYRVARILREDDLVPPHLWYLIQMLADKYLSKADVAPLHEDCAKSFRSVILFASGIFTGVFLMALVICLMR